MKGLKSSWFHISSLSYNLLSSLPETTPAARNALGILSCALLSPVASQGWPVGCRCLCSFAELPDTLTEGIHHSPLLLTAGDDGIDFHCSRRGRSDHVRDIHVEVTEWL